jgi:hypothetical protein
MKTKMTPIVSWSIWAGGLSLVMGIVTRNQLMAGFRSDETGMSYVIAAVFAAGLVISFLSARKLTKEWAVLAQIKKTDAIPKSSYSADLAAVFAKLKGFKDKGETVDAHTAIDTYHAKHNSRLRSVSIMAALVISMGLLGTVVGLIMAISGLGSMVENIGLSRTTMMDALKTTVSGMGTAFYTTFFGALGGLILRAVAVSELNSLSELCSEAAEYASNNLVSKAENKEEALNQQVAKVISSFENMQTEIDSLTGRIAIAIESTMTKFGESIATVGEHAMESTKEAITGMTDQMGTFGSTIEESFSSYNEVVVKAGEDAREAVGSINETIVKSGDELSESFGGLNETIGKAGEGVTESFEGLNGTIGKAGEGVTESFDELNGTIGKAGEAVTESFESLNGNIGESGEKVTEAFESLNGSVHQASDTVSGSLADFKLSIDGTAIELNEAVGELHGAISQATGEMVTMAKAKLDTDANEIAGQLALAADSIQGFLKGKITTSSDEDSNQKVA